MAARSALARYCAEFIGTYLLVFTVGCNVLCGSPVWAGLSIASLLMVMIYALGPISGAMFNPAVSFALGVAGKMQWLEVALYSSVQVVAGIAASMTYSGLFGKAFKLAPSAGFEWREVLLAESLYTFMLCFVVLNVAASRRNNPPEDGNEFFGLAIGSVIIAGSYGAGAVSGGAFNPAVAMSVETASLAYSPSYDAPWSIAYMFFELLGAVLAALMFRVCRPDEYGTLVGATYSLTTRLTSEFLGTFFLVLTVGLNVLAKSPAPALSIAASLTAMVYALGDVSGAHFNPAVTAAIVLGGRGKCSLQTGLLYTMVQLAAGIAAASTYTVIHRGQGFPLEPGQGFSWGAVGAAEAIFTFVLCYVVLSVATVENPHSNLFGFAIGSCVTVGGAAIGAVSGGSLNPAVSAGIASSSSFRNHGNFIAFILYCAFELVGAAAAAGMFRVIHAVEYGKGSLSRR